MNEHVLPYNIEVSQAIIVAIRNHEQRGNIKPDVFEESALSNGRHVLHFRSRDSAMAALSEIVDASGSSLSFEATRLRQEILEMSAVIPEFSKRLTDETQWLIEWETINQDRQALRERAGVTFAVVDDDQIVVAFDDLSAGIEWLTQTQEEMLIGGSRERAISLTELIEQFKRHPVRPRLMPIIHAEQSKHLAQFAQEHGVSPASVALDTLSRASEGR